MVENIRIVDAMMRNNQISLKRFRRKFRLLKHYVHITLKTAFVYSHFLNNFVFFCGKFFASTPKSLPKRKMMYSITNCGYVATS